MECDQMRFLFQYSPPCDPQSSFGIAVLGSHWSKIYIVNQAPCKIFLKFYSFQKSTMLKTCPKVTSAMTENLVGIALTLTIRLCDCRLMDKKDIWRIILRCYETWSQNKLDVQWVNCHLNYTKMKITLTSHFFRYIYQNYMKISWNIID